MISKNLYTEKQYTGKFPTRLRELMEKKNISNTSLGSSLGKSKQSISQYRSGLIDPSLDTLIKIADILDTTIDYLVGRTDDPNVQCSAVDDIGLSDTAVKKLMEYKGMEDIGYSHLMLIDAILSDPKIDDVMEKTMMYFAMIQAKQIVKHFHQKAVADGNHDLLSLNELILCLEVNDDEDKRKVERSKQFYKPLLNATFSTQFNPLLKIALLRLLDFLDPQESPLDEIYALKAQASLNELHERVVAKFEADQRARLMTMGEIEEIVSFDE